jgi:hypothetical protein
MIDLTSDTVTVFINYNMQLQCDKFQNNFMMLEFIGLIWFQVT